MDLLFGSPDLLARFPAKGKGSKGEECVREAWGKERGRDVRTKGRN